MLAQNECNCDILEVRISTHCFTVFNLNSRDGGTHARRLREYKTPFCLQSLPAGFKPVCVSAKGLTFAKGLTKGPPGTQSPQRYHVFIKAN